MRIHDWNPMQAYNQIQNGRTSSKQENKPYERKPGVPVPSTSRNTGDRLEISQEAQVKSHSAVLNGQSDGPQGSVARQARLEALRQQVQTGTYDVPAELVARKMLQALVHRS